MSKYKYTDKCDEISGFGGSYEDGYRKMVIAGLEYLDNHEKADPKFTELKNIYGLIFEDNDEAKKLTKHMNEYINNEATGAMMQCCLSHVKFAKQNGWEKYIQEMEKIDE